MKHIRRFNITALNRKKVDLILLLSETDNDSTFRLKQLKIAYFIFNTTLISLNFW